MTTITIGDGAFCINLHYFEQCNGAVINLWSKNGHDSQKWVYEDGAIKLAANRAFCINLHCFEKTHGALINLWRYTGHPSQKWDISGDKLVLHDDNRWVLNLHDMSLVDGATVNLWEDTGHASQQWSVLRQDVEGPRHSLGSPLGCVPKHITSLLEGQDEIVDHVMGAILGVFIGDALGMGVHWQYDLDKLEADRGYVTDYLTPLPGTYHAGKLSAGQLELQGAIDKLLLQSLAHKGELDQADFLQRFEDVILRDPNMDGTRQSGRYGWTDKVILDIWKRRVQDGLPWDQCTAPRADTPDPVVRGILLAARYHKSPRELCVQVNKHAKAQTADSSVQQHSVAFACNVAAVLEGQPLDASIGNKLYAQCGTVLPFSNIHITKDYDDQYGPYSEPDSLDWFSSMCKGLTGVDSKFKFEAEPAYRGVQLYGQACCFWETMSSAYYVVATNLGDFERAMLCSVNGGGQNCVRSSLVGGLLGAQVGLSRIPKRFIDGLDDSESIVAWAKKIAMDSLRGIDGDDWQWPASSLDEM
eukprot:TRINITY_DN63919_c0_g1_i1.p1 TRINITY_DN63919_c0_g1~~TRINITY_DN63919_c0_g1_i1.p1  ORF type:complete len:529 (+),score=91.68 TRINITY_DN63919_c0_g1_i1:12-1598(+)